MHQRCRVLQKVNTKQAQMLHAVLVGKHLSGLFQTLHLLHGHLQLQIHGPESLFIPTDARLTRFCYWFHSSSKVESSFLLKFNLQIQANLFLISTALGLEQKGNITSSATNFLSMYTREGTAYIIKKKKHVSIYTPRFSPKILFRQNHCKHLNCKRSC